MKKLCNNISDVSLSTKEIQEAGRELDRKRNPLWLKNKKRFFGFSCFIMLVILFAATILVFVKPNDVACQVSMYAEVNGIRMDDNGTYTVKPGDVITIEASSSKTEIAFIGYYFSTLDEDNTQNTQQVNSNKVEITVPSVDQDTTLILSVEAVAANDNGKNNKTTKTGWKNYVLNISSPCQVNMYAELNGAKMEDNTRHLVNPGDVVVVEVSSTEAPIAFISYYFAPLFSYEDRIKVYDNRVEIVIPDGEPGSLLNLMVEPVAANDDGSANTVTKTGWKKFTLEYSTRSARVLVNNVEVKNDSTAKVRAGDTVTIFINPADKVDTLYYKLSYENGDSAVTSAASSLARFTIPNDATPGETYTIFINAFFVDGSYIDNKDKEHTVPKEYQFEVID